MVDETSAMEDHAPDYDLIIGMRLSMASFHALVVEIQTFENTISSRYFDHFPRRLNLLTKYGLERYRARVHTFDLKWPIFHNAKREHRDMIK